ncbi:MAG: hypothetical protein LBV43_02310 [Prevotella sp.]|jgi:hypothetical protein|nr:hypothetical protein [Prevotella sp.]
MKKLFILISFLFSVITLISQEQCVSIKKIWDNGKHCAFTSLIKFNGKYYCSFREGETHIFGLDGKAEGKSRILVSEDGENWQPIALLEKKDYDLRDPKLSITPDGQLMVLMGGSVYVDKKLVNRYPQVSFSKDGTHFTKPVPIHFNDGASGHDWLWRVTWDGGTGYGANYYTDKGENKISLVKTTDGLKYDLVTILDVTELPNEATIRILPDKRMLMMVRRETGNRRGYWGISNPPYKEWEWKEMELQLGGPDFIQAGENFFIAGTRSYFISSAHKSILLTGDTDGRFQEVYMLPSGGDTSYPAFLIEGDEVWVSYYSMHETKNASIYLAKFPLSFFKGKN